MKTDNIKGAVVASALGDALGAPYEGGILEQAAWSLIGKTRGIYRYTDDTRMSIDIAESLIACGGVNQDDLAGRFAASYQATRGYGPGAAKILKMIRGGLSWREAARAVYKDGSFGNGAAMRVAPVGLFFANRTNDEIRDAATQTAVITHAHPLGIEGAVLIAVAVARAAAGIETEEVVSQLSQTANELSFIERLSVVEKWMVLETPPPFSEIRAHLGNGIAALDSATTAIYCALIHRERSFEDLLRFIRTLGGDVDTIGAMSGAIWGAFNGASALPESMLSVLEQRTYLENLAERLAAVCM